MVGDRRIDVWQARTDVSPARLRELLAVLSPHERARGARGGARHERWAAGRAALRLILAQYMHRSAAELRFGHGPGGKPELAGLQFSLSHSGCRVLVAVSPGGPVGVDIERIEPARALARIAERMGLRGDPDPVLTAAAFYGRWTAMEAVAKGLGGGITGPAGEADGWDVRPLPAPAGYAAAVAAPGHSWQVRVRAWEWK